MKGNFFKELMKNMKSKALQNPKYHESLKNWNSLKQSNISAYETLWKNLQKDLSKFSQKSSKSFSTSPHFDSVHFRNFKNFKSTFSSFSSGSNSSNFNFFRGRLQRPFSSSYNFSFSSESSGFDLSPLYKIIGLNLFVYLLWHTDFVSERFKTHHLALSRATLAQGNIHTLLTYGFSHTNLMHLLFNMITLYSFGRTILFSFGKNMFYKLYLGGTFCGGILQTMVGSDYSLTLGASAATSAMITYFILNFPHTTILFFIFPMPAWALGAGLMVYSALFMGSSGNGGVAHGAHFGGCLTGAGLFFASGGRIKMGW